MGIAATGTQVTRSGVMIDGVVGGKITEEWEEYDALGMVQQLGAVPSIPSMARTEGWLLQRHPVRLLPLLLVDGRGKGSASTLSTCPGFCR